MERSFVIQIPKIISALSGSSTKPVYTKNLREKFTNLLWEVAPIVKDHQTYFEKVIEEYESVLQKKKEEWTESDALEFEKFVAKHALYQKYMKEKIKIKTEIKKDDLNDSEFDVSVMYLLFGTVIK